VGNLYIKRL